MSTEYIIGEGVSLIEQSSRVQIIIEGESLAAESNVMDSEQLRTCIIRMIEVLSYISDDPNEVLARFGVAKYGEQK